MKIEDLLRMAFKDGERYATRKSDLKIDDLVNDSEYSGAIELVKNNLLHNVIEFSEGDEVLYVGTYLGVVQRDRTVLLKDGTFVRSLDNQRQKFRRVV